MWIFMLGFIFGGFFGMFLICLMQICRTDRNIKTAKEYREEIKTFIEYIKTTIKREKNAEKNKEYTAGMEDVANMYEKFFKEDL